LSTNITLRYTFSHEGLGSLSGETRIPSSLSTPPFSTHLKGRPTCGRARAFFPKGNRTDFPTLTFSPEESAKSERS
ncbi:hypothetical protein CLOM_g19563, partial [Closterium sp. NIES-68]